MEVDHKAVSANYARDLIYNIFPHYFELPLYVKINDFIIIIHI